MTIIPTHMLPILSSALGPCRRWAVACAVIVWMMTVPVMSASAQISLGSQRDATTPEAALTDAVALDAADRLYLAGDMTGAASSYKRALAAFPDTAYLDQGLYRLGLALVALNRKGEAREYWQRLLAQVPDSPYAEEVGSELLTIYRDGGEWDRALDILLNQLGQAQGERKAALLDEIALVRMSLGEPERAIKDLIRRQRYLPPLEREAGREHIRRVVDEQLSVAELSAMAAHFTNPVPGAWIMERLVRHHLNAGEVYQTDRWVQRYLDTFPERPLAKVVQRQVKEQRKALRAKPHRVAVLLPLSGPLGDYGRPVLNGIRVARQMAQTVLPDSELALWVRDQTIDLPLLGGHVKRVLKDADPQILIGPLLSHQVVQAARLTRAAGVPIISPLTAVPPNAGDGVIGLGVTPEAEAIAAARYATQSVGLERFVIMAPVGPYGDRVSSAFTDAVAAMGGTIQETIRYAPDGSGVRKQMQRLVAADLAANGVAEVTEADMAHLDDNEKTLAGLDDDEEPTIEIGLTPSLPLQGPPVGPHPYYPGFDGVFVAGPWQQVVLVVPQLPFHDIRVPIIGSAGWHDQRLIKKGGSAVKNARFMSPMYHGDGLGRRFAQAYQAAYDRPPDLFAALGFDAMNLAIHALTTEGGSLAERLTTPFTSVTGIIGFDDELGLVRDFAALKVGRRQFTLEERVPAMLPSVVEAPEADLFFDDDSPIEMFIDSEGNAVFGVQ